MKSLRKVVRHANRQLLFAMFNMEEIWWKSCFLTVPRWRKFTVASKISSPSLMPKTASFSSWWPWRKRSVAGLRLRRPAAFCPIWHPHVNHIPKCFQESLDKKRFQEPDVNLQIKTMYDRLTYCYQHHLSVARKFLQKPTYSIYTVYKYISIQI